MKVEVTKKNFSKKTLDEWESAFYALYGNVDDKRSLGSMWQHAVVNASQFSTDIRKKNFGLSFHHLAHLACWLFTSFERCRRSAVVDKNSLFFTDKKFSEVIWEKYPNLCPYCGTNPCSCTYPGRVENKSGTLKKNHGKKNKPKTLDQWCLMFDDIYGGIHSIAPIEELAFHLTEEVGEVLFAIIRITEMINGKPSEMKRQDLFLEMADVFSWICSLINKTNRTYFGPAARHFEDKQKIPHGSLPIFYIQPFALG